MTSLRLTDHDQHCFAAACGAKTQHPVTTAKATADPLNPDIHTKPWLDPALVAKVQKESDSSPINLAQDEGAWMQCYNICSVGFK
jgi:hypothetical protein